MAAKPKPKPRKPAPQTAQEKEAKALMAAQDAATVQASAAKAAGQTKGAFRGRRLRAGGDDLARYLLPGKYSDDPGIYAPAPPPPPPGGGGGSSGGTRNRNRQPTQGSGRMPNVSKKQAQKKQNELSDARGRENQRLLRERQAEARRKKAARSKAGQSQQRQARSTPVKPKPYSAPTRPRQV